MEDVLKSNENLIAMGKAQPVTSTLSNKHTHVHTRCQVSLLYCNFFLNSCNKEQG
jgi:hypothetical protein